MPSEPRVLRLLDASHNRASEGLRVVEDYARFVLDDAHLTGLAKHLRHDMTAVAPMAVDRLAVRETQTDVGTAISTPGEGQRADAWSVCLASLERCQQALRSLEEYGKTIDPRLGGAYEGLRYRAYTLAKALGATTAARARLAGVRLYALIEGGASQAVFAERLEQLCVAGVEAIQLRDKLLADRELMQRARSLASLCRRHGVVSIVNDRPDIAVAAGADGVHVGQEELSVADVRAVVGPLRLIGVSTHSIDQARAAVLDGADYLGVGPTFPSGTKSFDAFPGVALVRAVAAEITLPAFAIGGITPENLGEVVAAGLHRVAVAGALANASDPAAAIRLLKQALEDRSAT